MGRELGISPVSQVFIQYSVGLTLLGLFWVLSALFIAYERCLVRLRYETVNVPFVRLFRGHGKVCFLLGKAEELPNFIRSVNYFFSMCLGLSFAYWIFIAGETQVPKFSVLGEKALLFLAGYWFMMFASFMVARWAQVRYRQVIVVLSELVWVLYKVLGPVLRFFKGVAKYTLRLSGVKDGGDVNVLDADVQIRAISKPDGHVSKKAHEITKSALRLKELDASDILLPRSQIEYLDIQDTLEENLKLAKDHGHTRYPVCDGDLDHCLGIVHIKDIFRYAGRVDRLNLVKLMRPVVRLHEEMPVEAVLERLLEARSHMALVVDEFGGVIGAVTLENVLEELVGPIQDEFDIAEDLEIRPLSGGAYYISGLAPLHEVEETLGVEFDTDEVSTFGGYIVSQMGRIPKQRESVSFMGWYVRITEVDEKRIIGVLVKKIKENGE